MSKLESRSADILLGKKKKMREMLRAQRISNVETEAQVVLLMEAKTVAESEVAVAHRVMGMRAALDLQHSSAAPVPGEPHASPLAAGLIFLF